MNRDDESLVPRKPAPLFAVTPDDILENALNNLDEKQTSAISKKAAEELVRVAVEKKLSEQKSDAAQTELRNMIHNAEMLEQRGGEYKITGTFEHASGTTQIEIKKSTTTKMAILIGAVAVLGLLLLLAIILIKN